MLLVIATFATVLDILSLLIKFRFKRYADGTVDAVVILLVFLILKGSELMLLVGIFSSLIVSLYLWVYPPKLSRLLR